MSHRLFIADDEPLARERVIRLLAGSAYEVVGQAANGEQAIQGIQQLKPDIALLDIRMPGKDGLEAAQEISNLPYPPAIIFLTAYDDYLMEAFQVNAQGYLLKPIRKEALITAIEKATRVTQAQLNRLREDLAPSETRDYLIAHTARGEQRIPLPEILYLQAELKYVTVYTLGGEVLTDQSLKDIESQHSRLKRIHRHTLINQQHLEAIERTTDGGVQVRLRHLAEPLPVSRRMVAEVKLLLQRT
ncbi:MAG: response regulator transcription factor [Hahellaceae bacterium]|nr:response regulator transcription factor [Hahellaceae bacterium]